MENIQGILSKQEYGMIKIKLKQKMDECNITRYRMSKLADTRFEVINKWYDGTVERIDVDILARFCHVLNCQVSDIIEYIGVPD
ncbi:MAG: helix-turn-helix transcriptional regulator [Clostridia bacterium]|nr:helix-turn-helix transcriptional regulator [Clostridia bacterium]